MSDALLTRIAVALEALVAIKSGKPATASAAGTAKPATAPAAGTAKPATAPAAGAAKPATAPKATPAPGTKAAAPTKPAAAAPKPAATATATAPATGPSDDTKDPNGKNTYKDVVDALKAVKNAQNKDAALAIMKNVGGVDSVRDLKPALYDAVVAAAMQVVHPPKATAAGTVIVTDELGNEIDTSGAGAATADENDPPEGGSGEDI